jgi:pSer/pThr/pTyr-binding forkhead associated (FHA) protein
VPELVLDILKFVFIIVLYIFVGRAVRAVWAELKPATSGAPVARNPAPAARPKEGRAKKAPRKVAVIEGEKLKGKTFNLGDELIIGRADKCHIVMDDTYVSQVHARIFSRGDNYMVEDLGSTNGTYLNRRRITAPSELQRGDRVKIGKTVLEARR